MKGFGIYIQNDLLEPKHVKSMRNAVWLYMWLIDHMTSISEEQVGLVLGGRPVKYEEVAAELGIARNVYCEWVEKLRAYPYIETTRTPYGIVFRVFKAKKRFKKGVEMYGKASRDVRKSGNVIKTIQDNNKRMKTSKTFSPLQGKNSPRSMEVVPIDDDGQEIRPRRTGPKPEGKNKIAMRLQRKFVEMAQKQLGSSPVMDVKGYKMCLYAMNTGGLTEVQIVDLFDEWFKLGKPDEETISITRALSARQIEGYKVRNNVK